MRDTKREQKAKARGMILKVARVKLGLNMEQLAERAKTTGASISFYESGERNPRLDQLTNIVHALKLDKETVCKLLGFR